MSEISEVHAREILDSRGNPTVEVEALLESGAVGRAAVPSGASTGEREALELRDGDSSRYQGKGVIKAVENVNETIAPEVIGLEATEQAVLDQLLCELDGTEDKRKLGANAVLGVSLAVAHAAAAARGEELFVHLNRLWRDRLEPGERTRIDSAPTLPMPMVNMISGGLHAGRNLDIQDVLIIPVGARSYSEALEISVAMYGAVGGVLAERGLESALVGDEGGVRSQAPRQ